MLTLDPLVLDINEVKALALGQGTCVKKKEGRVTLCLHPKYAGDVRKGVADQLGIMTRRYCRQLGGILMSWEKIGVCPTGDLFGINPFVHVEVQGTFYVFAPEVNAILEGTVKKKSPNHLSCLVHKMFNVSVPRPHRLFSQTWEGSTVEEKDVIKVVVTQVDMSFHLPMIVARLESVVTRKSVEVSIVDAPQKDSKKGIAVGDSGISSSEEAESELPERTVKEEVIEPSEKKKKKKDKKKSLTPLKAEIGSEEKKKGKVSKNITKEKKAKKDIKVESLVESDGAEDNCDVSFGLASSFSSDNSKKEKKKIKKVKKEVEEVSYVGSDGAVDDCDMSFGLSSIWASNESKKEKKKIKKMKKEVEEVSYVDSDVAVDDCDTSFGLSSIWASNESKKEKKKIKKVKKELEENSYVDSDVAEDDCDISFGLSSIWESNESKKLKKVKKVKKEMKEKSPEDDFDLSFGLSNKNSKKEKKKMKKMMKDLRQSPLELSGLSVKSEGEAKVSNKKKKKKKNDKSCEEDVLDPFIEASSSDWLGVNGNGTQKEKKHDGSNVSLDERDHMFLNSVKKSNKRKADESPGSPRLKKKKKLFS